MANPETTTPSVEGDRLEAIARIIDPAAFVYSRGKYGMNCGEQDAALAKARQIAALPCKGGEACQNCGSTDTVENLTAGGFVSCCPERKMAATPEPDTGRGLREALEFYANQHNHGESRQMREDEYGGRARQALAALSDTPRGREEEGKQGLMASRDLGPTTVASSLKGSDVGEVKP